jgi:serine/threonine protein phosphatase PrpC
MKKIIIPTITKAGFIEKVELVPHLILGTTVGLVKSINEDRSGCVLDGNSLRICVADGHWGEAAAETIVEHWIKKKMEFPVNRDEALSEAIKIEEKLFKSFGKTNMNPDLDFTPEASFISIQIEENTLKAISYGDSRLLVARNGKVKAQLATKETWLGVFSKLGLRNRISVKQGLVFEEIQLKEADVVLIFTDGIDQCVYEKDTLSSQFLAKQTKTDAVKKIFDSIFDAVFAAGAEDNATLVVLKI